MSAAPALADPVPLGPVVGSLSPKGLIAEGFDLAEVPEAG